MRKHLALLFGALSLVVLTCGSAFAAYPEKPITLIVPFGAGGATDVPARLLAGMLEKKIGRPIIVQNIAGAAGAQGMAHVAAAPDGYTLGYAPTGAACLQLHVQTQPYGKDSFTFLGMAVRQPVAVMSTQKAPWKNFAEMADIVRKNPNKYIVGITGVSNMTHVPMAALAKHYGFAFRYIPYRSSPELMKDRITGRVHLYGDTPVALAQFDIFGLAQFADVPADNLKDLPLAKDLGFDKVYSHWQGVIAPKGLPEDVRAFLGAAVKEVVESAEFAAEAAKLSTTAHWMGPDDFQALFEKEFDMYGEEVKYLMPKK